MLGISSVHRKGLWTAAIVLGLDQASKAWVVSHSHLLVKVCPHLNFISVFNRGVTFGFLGGGQPWQLMLIGTTTVVIGAWLIVQFKRTTHLFPALCLGGFWEAPSETSSTVCFVELLLILLIFISNTYVCHFIVATTGTGQLSTLQTALL